MLRYRLDIHIVIDVLKRLPLKVLSSFNAKASRMAISSITMARLVQSKKICQPPGVNALHITGPTRSKGLVLITNYVSAFVRLPAPELENWAK
jgi:tRNA(fMet)-specific endonuclease VapC